jgi:hypothetical protein
MLSALPTLAGFPFVSEGTEPRSVQPLCGLHVGACRFNRQCCAEVLNGSADVAEELVDFSEKKIANTVLIEYTASSRCPL